MPQPIIKYDENGLYGTFPFEVNDSLSDYHLVIIGKPGIPVISDVKNLKNNYQYLVDNDYSPENEGVVVWLSYPEIERQIKKLDTTFDNDKIIIENKDLIEK